MGLARFMTLEGSIVHVLRQVCYRAYSVGDRFFPIRPTGDLKVTLILTVFDAFSDFPLWWDFLTTAISPGTMGDGDV